MTTNIHTSISFKTTNWSGGSTTELFIYPPESDFQRRDFDFRLSTATVEVVKSIFTPLPGISRTLMVLDGQMTLTHENHHSKTLKTFDVDNFDGGWNTQSNGRCIDFNLMTKGNATGELDHLTLNKKETNIVELSSRYKWVFIYLNRGSLNISSENEKLNINEGDLIAVSDLENQKLLFEANAPTEIVLIKIFEGS